MSDPQEADEPQQLPESSRLALPPRLTPSPDATESEFKLSRKREREVSLEPVTTPTAHNDTDPTPRERTDSHSRTPFKKNRRRLDPTEEEEDGGGSGSRSGSGSPPTNTMSVLESPRQEMKNKVRQISRGVEDITWKSMESIPTHNNHDTAVESKVSEIIPEEADIPGADDAKTNPNNMDHEEDSPPKTPEESALSRSVQDIRNVDDAMVLGTPDASRLRAGSDSNEKGLKRKYLERGTSHGPPEQGDAAQHPSEPLKRLRDEGAVDPNLRETKKPSPPPASPPRESPPSPKIPKLSGFMAYASTSSPFSSVKGQSIFGSSKSVSTFSAFSESPARGPSPLAPAAELGLPFGSSSSASTPAVVPTVPKRSGFEAFASSSSPFATAARTNTAVLGSTSKLGRAASPPTFARSASALNLNPFASYAGPSQGFALPAQKRARAGSPDGSTQSSLERASASDIFKDSRNGSESGDEEQDDEPTTFGDRLRAGRDDEDENKSDEDNQKLDLKEQDVPTGEEDEETLHTVRGKLFALDGNVWKERGTGLLRLNVKIDDGTGARLVMRKDAVLSLLLNVTLFPGMRCSLAQDPRYIRFSAIENGVTTTYNLKVSNAKIAADLVEEINANIPT